MSIAVAFLQAIGVPLLVVLFFVVIVGGVLIAAVFGRAAGERDPNRPVGEPRRSLFPARILCAVGLGFAVLGAFFVSVGTNVVGIVLGAVGYYLGARVFGVVVIVLSVATLFIGLLIGQGAIPGSYDEIMNGYTPRH
jgi:hypothetical protein